MKLKEFNILLDIKKMNKTEYIEVVRGDANTNVFNISLVDGANPYDLYGLDVNIIFKKADGTTVQQTEIEKINDVQGKIKCVLKTNTIACVGKVVAEVKIISEGKLLTSTNFSFYVRDSLLSDETIESTNEFPILTQLIEQTSQLIDEVRQIEEQVPQSVVDRINALETTTDALSTEMVGKVNKSSIANNLVTTESGMVLDARQGKVLQGQITEQNNNLSGLTNLTGTFPGNTQIIIRNGGDRFAYMLSVQGADGLSYGTYIMQGYGTGTPSRYHIANLQSGSSVNVSIQDTTFIVSSTSQPCYYSLLILFGAKPTITML